MRVGDLVKCKNGACMYIDGGVGIIIQIEKYDPDNLSICVQWNDDFLWYEKDDLEVINEK